MKHTESTANALYDATVEAGNIVALLRPMQDDTTIRELLNEACQLKNRLQSEEGKTDKETDNHPNLPYLILR